MVNPMAATTQLHYNDSHPKKIQKSSGSEYSYWCYESLYLQKGRKRKLREFDNDDEGSDLLAEASRPRRGLKEDIRIKSREAHSGDRKRTDVDSVAKNMNYFQPLIWSQIEQAAKKAGMKFSVLPSSRTQRYSKSFLPRCRWIYRDAQKEGMHRWTAKVLGYVWRWMLLVVILHGNTRKWN